MVFNEDDPKYRCCCHKCHILTGCWIIGIVELVLVILNFLANIRGIHQGGLGVGAFSLSTFVLIVFLVVVVFYMMGLRKHNPKYLIPHLIWSAFCVIMQIVLIVVIILGMVKGGLDSLHGLVADEKQQADLKEFIDKEEKHSVHFILLIMVVIFIFASLFIGIFLAVWFFIIVFRGYRYMKDKAHYTDTTPASIPLVTTPTAPTVTVSAEHDTDHVSDAKKY